jgi:uncharacterized protein
MQTTIEFNQEFIDNLNLNTNKIIENTASQLDIRNNQASVVIELLNEGSTVPFISRYRKERTGSLDEVQVRNIEQIYNTLKNLETRKLEIIKSIYSQNLLEPNIYENINKSKTLTELEELYAPYKKKKKTRAMIAIEKGLEGLANMILLLNEKVLVEKAITFINIEKDIKSSDEALQGAMDIIAERISQDVELRKKLKDYFDNRVFLITEGQKEEEKSVYKNYYKYKEIVKNIRPHHILAINRGENEEELKVKFDYDENDLNRLALSQYKINNTFHTKAIEDGLKRLLIPSITREIRTLVTEKSEEHSISIFSKNLKDLLMQPPIKRTRIIGVDPGIRTGTKCAVIDENGTYIDNFIFYNNQSDKAKSLIAEKVKQYNTELIAIGNGTGSHEVQEIISNSISENSLNVQYTVVPEDGASVYSASEIAGEEFPQLDLTIRGAISIGRRLQDPLAELVKIDPKSIGVGLYQHDLNQKKLGESVNNTVESVVNQVGVNLNTASASLLKHISGISSNVAKNIVKYREENGIIKSRAELKKIAGIGAKVFEQASGFLMIPESSNNLDNTWIHPENYKIGKAIYDIIKKGKVFDNSTKQELIKTHSVGDTTINDIVEAIKKPGRDPREDYPKPIMQTGVINFSDLKVGMKIKGKVKNVVDFGAFIDIGIKETALLHVSEMSNKFIKNPMEIVKIGDVLELKIISIDEVRKRVSVSLKG